jgi:two-component system phosphate regulon sensor histidine kinase PhoR
MRSKRADFAKAIRVLPPRLWPPKVLWLRCGNQPTREIENLLRALHAEILQFEVDPTAVRGPQIRQGMPACSPLSLVWSHCAIENQPMPSPSHCTVEHLAEVFGKCQEEIIGEWRSQAGELLRELHLDNPTITDHLPDVIAEITRDLALSREGTLSAEHTRGSPPVHGVQRFHDGLDMGEVVAEYNLLRVAFITVAERHGLYVVGEAARIINHRIDEAVRMAVMAFAAQQALIRKEQEEEHLAFIAHDLRTPLNAVSLLVEDLRQSLDQKVLAELGDVFEIVQRNLSRVEILIKKVLDIGVLPPEIGASFRPERRTFELWPLVQRLILDLRSVSSKHAVEVVNQIPRALTVYADAGLISQVFQNLLGNAFKYAARGQVTVSAWHDQKNVTCAVCDNGAGIPLEMLARVFDKLTTDPDKEGTGLGLAIVKQIVEAHGGTVNAESVHGAGATFSFTIPTPLEG